MYICNKEERVFYQMRDDVDDRPSRVKRGQDYPDDIPKKGIEYRSGTKK